jgi:hypothetical protein
MVWDPGSRIRDPGSGKNLFRILEPGVKKAPDPGSGSATLTLGYPYRLSCFTYGYLPGRWWRLRPAVERSRPAVLDRRAVSRGARLCWPAAVQLARSVGAEEGGRRSGPAVLYRQPHNRRMKIAMLWY